MPENDKHILLTAEQIEEISAVLHSNMQFYDSEGRAANGAVLEQVEKVLTEFMGKESDARE